MDVKVLQSIADRAIAPFESRSDLTYDDVFLIYQGLRAGFALAGATALDMRNWLEFCLGTDPSANVTPRALVGREAAQVLAIREAMCDAFGVDMLFVDKARTLFRLRTRSVH